MIKLITNYFQVQRSDNEQVSEKQRNYALRFLNKSNLGKRVRDSGLEMKQNGEDRWTATWMDGQGIPVNSKDDPVTDFNQTPSFQRGMPNVTRSGYGYLENGKLLLVQKTETFWPAVGLITVGLKHSSFEIDETDCFVWVQKFQNLHTGSICIITVRKTRG